MHKKQATNPLTIFPLRHSGSLYYKHHKQLVQRY